MDFDVPTDLIHQAQIGFREDAGVSSFDPKDTTLPSLPTVEVSISALDPSPPYLRCKYCEGKLLRGLQSLICIYCGEYQKKDLNPDPISFKSTNGYLWLLQSLNLNGSEMVGSLAEGNGMNGRKSPAEDEITLSELLDLQISWRDKPEKPKSSFDKTFERNNSFLNINTDELHNFFTGPDRANASAASEEQPVTSKNDQSKDFGDQENLGQFENVLPPEAADTSAIDASGDASSGWDAEFQFVDSNNTIESSKSVDPFVGTQVDLSSHLDSVFGHVEDLNKGNLNDDSHPLPSIDNDWVQDDLFPITSSANFQQVQAMDGSSDHLNDASLEGLDGDWFNDNNWQKSSANNTAVPQQAEQLDFVYELKDGPSQDNLKDSSSEGVQVDWFENTDRLKSTPINPTTDKDDNLFDIKPNVNTVSSPSLVNDSIQNDRSDFDNSNKNRSDPTDWFQDSQWQIDGSSATNMVASKDDDSFDEWNDFTSSTVNQDSFQESWKQSGNKNASGSEKMPELSLFPSTTDPQDMDFGNFSQSDFFSGASSNKNQSDTQGVYDIFSEVSTTNRNGDAEEGPKKNDVEMLLSQMHDLSFMLKNELSIPSRSDDVGPPPHS